VVAVAAVADVVLVAAELPARVAHLLQADLLPVVHLPQQLARLPVEHPVEHRAVAVAVEVVVAAVVAAHW
jgi:hypothetical protein